MRNQLDTVTTELRRRVGGTFTIRELADEYVRADGWAREALAEQATPGWPRTLALVEGAAFHLYARGAVDYRRDDAGADARSTATGGAAGTRSVACCWSSSG